MNWKALIAGLAAGMAMSSSADATNIFFSFTNDPLYGNVSGTVTGEIFGLTNNATSSASGVVVDSYPSGITDLPSSAPFYVSTYASDIGKSISENSFTLVNDQVVAAEYQIYGGYFDLNVPAGPYYYDTLTGADAVNRVQNQALTYLGGVSFYLVPEPSTWALLLASLFGVGALAGYARRRASKAA